MTIITEKRVIMTIKAIPSLTTTMARIIIQVGITGMDMTITDLLMVGVVAGVD